MGTTGWSIIKELLKGRTGTLVLTLLARKQMYGYEIVKELELILAGTFEMKEGTLYPILHAREESSFVESKLLSGYYTVINSDRDRSRGSAARVRGFDGVARRTLDDRRSP
jgi:hypothetical protein